MYLLFFLIILPVLFSCQKNDPILIGFSNQLSGSQSALGVDSMYGALLAVNEINENGGINGRQVKLIIRDDKGDPSLAVEIDNELKDLGCVAIIGHGTSSMASATKANADLNDILLLSPTISSSLLDGLDDNFFRVIPSNSTQGTALAEFIFEHTAG